jgi:hypothetical protein
VEQVEDLVEPGEVELPGPWLEVRPAEDVEGDEVDARLLHERDVFAPDGPIPLLGVVVAAVGDAVVAERGGRAHGAFRDL